MKTITHVESIETFGLSIKITTSQTQNAILIQKHWMHFNTEIQRLKLSQNTANWVKYGFTYKVSEKYFYCAAIPFSGQQLPENFQRLSIPKGVYIVFEHAGKMDDIKNTIYMIYKVELSKAIVQVEDHLKVGFIHFEKYDSRFNWNNPQSVFEIHLPLKSSSGFKLMS
ncbi:putative transcriptional regulator YdeE [Flavobacterium sp. 28A]|uniref:GyrI-like domain-containing protein n=1 Tax=Flavobacterium sp. 28A TaxID=2735895 RepID=UPI00156FF4BA|nr:GyrI-like domain-containing protein [Flavobacterium sp. 28A]NRT14099.1 putative transcriptional regulator YdeE [Flavobacterium sp. 28A]